MPSVRAGNNRMSVTARCLEADPQARRIGKPDKLAAECGNAGLGIEYPPEHSCRVGMDNEFVLGNIDADKQVGV